MGIGDWFQRFKKNAAALEQNREGTMGTDSDSQAARAEREHQNAPGAEAPATGQSAGGSDESEPA